MKEEEKREKKGSHNGWLVGWLVDGASLETAPASQGARYHF